MGLRLRERVATDDACGLLADDPVAVPMIHEGVCRVASADRGDPMAARFRVGDPAVAVVVPTSKGFTGR